MREPYRLGSTLTDLEWTEVLQDRNLTNDVDRKILSAMYACEKHQTSSGQIGLFLGYTGSNSSAPINLEMGRWGKRVVQKYPVTFTKREDGSERKWDIFFDGWGDKSGLFIWKMKSELVNAFEQTNSAENTLFPEEIDRKREGLLEGTIKSILINSYERNPVARETCIKHHGCVCSVCDFDFEKIFGEIGRGYIHVHHITPLSEIKGPHQVDPITDMIPVCPNCHAMLHRTREGMSIEELRSIVHLNK